MKYAITGLLTVAILVCLPGVIQGQTETGVKQLPDEELKAKYDQAMRVRDYTGGIPYMKELVERHPKETKYVRYRYSLAHTYLLMGRLDEADPEYDRVLEIDSNYLEAYLGQAIIYARQNKEKDAKDKMLDAARKGYPVREMQRMMELRRYLVGNVQFFLKMVERDVPQVEHTRDPFLNPLRKKSGLPEEPGPDEPVVPVFVKGDPEPMQRDKMIKMKDLLVLVQQSLAAGEEEEARKKFQQFKELYNDVVLGRITKEEYREQMEETWKVAQETVYPRLRQIELRKFKEEARAGLDELYEDYRNQDIEAARQHNAELIKILEPKMKMDEDFKNLAMAFDKERADMFERIKILEEFHKNVKPFLRLTGTIIGLGPKPPPKPGEMKKGPDMDKSEEAKKIMRKIAVMESVFGGESKKSSLEEGNSLPRMDSFIVLKIEEDRILARYRGEQVEVLLGTGF